MIRLQRASIAAIVAIAIQVPVGAGAMDPLVVVRAFCRADGAGDRLSPVAWNAVAPLVDWAFEPAWDRIVLIKGYEITTPRWVGDRVEVGLQYTVTADVVPGEVRRAKREESLTLVLLPTPDEGWLVSGPPPPPHVFASTVDPEALAELLRPDTNYESNTAYVWKLLRDNGWAIPYMPSTSIPTSPHFQEVGTASPGDLVVYLFDGAPYHVAWVDTLESVQSRTLNAGRRSLPFAAFAGPIRYWRPQGVQESGVGEETPSPAPLRRP